MESDIVWRLSAPAPKFYCDNNVHRLGRSLRMLGYDTLFFGAGPDDELRALRDSTCRILLSRDSDFFGEARSFVVTSDLYMEQLEAVVREFGLDISAYRYSLCLNCNRSIREVSVSDFSQEVPGWLVDEGAPLWQCPDCLKLYWSGSHLEHMDARFDGLLGGSVD